TFLAGLGVTKLFLEAGNRDLAVRYGVSVVAAYATFLLLLAGWLRYMRIREPGVDVGDALDLADAALDFGTGPAKDVGFQGAGGSFGGGGASADWGSSSSSVGSGLGDLIPDDEDLGLIILIVVVVVGITLAALYLVYAAPTILAEVAFDALLASTLVRGARQADAAGWLSPAVKATVIPFGIMFLLATGFGVVANKKCPTARRAVDVVRCAGL
ncbi:MAG TPA: hypothetical protein VFM29_07320, partial [Vicinamibacteria bacterium]|nr:hypothetical protein [Vicinamibacteria bacterium]